MKPIDLIAWLVISAAIGGAFAVAGQFSTGLAIASVWMFMGWIWCQ